MEISDDGLGTAAHVQLLKDFCQMILDSKLANVEPGADFLVAEALRQKVQDTRARGRLRRHGRFPV